MTDDMSTKDFGLDNLRYSLAEIMDWHLMQMCHVCLKNVEDDKDALRTDGDEDGFWYYKLKGFTHPAVRQNDDYIEVVECKGRYVLCHECYKQLIYNSPLREKIEELTARAEAEEKQHISQYLQSKGLE